VVTTAKKIREQARAQIVQEIKAAARRQLAVDGASGLSLRAVARELEMASSAIYRYFPSRDDLLTALIVDAYDAVGEAAERADAAHAHDEPMVRWAAVCSAVRAWAQRDPNEYALVYGSPVPSYRAPQDTTAHAARVTLVLAGIVRDATASPAPSTPQPGHDADSALHSDLLREIMINVPPEIVTRGLVAWTELFGVITFELFGHLDGSVIDYNGFFDRAVQLTGRFIGLDSLPSPPQ
jgi:AcrR family transcriptional regulator